MKNSQHTISLLVCNRPGALIRIALVFARRGFNIDSLVVSESKDPLYSRMNIVATGDTKTLQLMLNQLNKLIDVVHAKDYSDTDVIQKELALIKVECNDNNRTAILQIADAFKCRNVDISDSTMTFQVTGKSSKIDAVRKMFESYNVLEIVRTGKILMARGDEETA
ncbi:acetolactate synthase small subunit [Spirochaeta isovalerica]|uniref:Acetolactate synthase small subunit n=1 Tax=Spirochaeta isovalerica TaxID=150 RepID=A0A841RBE2_9SPIO|nr:acetolactate synthase small subunit [Spirochaeta isovalerica]MBB6481285.1 acetolactate synthase-1/3 small subunit [Spirochaeta isovalerica]